MAIDHDTVDVNREQVDVLEAPLHKLLRPDSLGFTGETAALSTFSWDLDIVKISIANIRPSCFEEYSVNYCL